MTTQSDKDRAFPRPPLPAVPVDQADRVASAEPTAVDPIEELDVTELQVEEPTGEPLSIEPVTPAPAVEPLGELDTGAEGDEAAREAREAASPPIQGTDLDHLFEVPQFDDPDMEVRDLISLDVEEDIVGGSLDEATSVTEEDILGDSFDVMEPDEPERPAPRPTARPQRVTRKRPPLPPPGGVIRMR